MKRKLLLAVCLGALAAPLAHADNDIKTRQQYMKDWGRLSKQMGSLIKQGNAQNFDAAAFARLAAQLQQSADKPWPHYRAGSDGRGSDAAAAVWENPQAFQAAIKRFTDAAAALNVAAQSGSYDQVKAPFGQLGESCKACHKAFKD